MIGDDKSAEASCPRRKDEQVGNCGMRWPDETLRRRKGSWNEVRCFDEKGVDVVITQSSA